MTKNQTKLQRELVGLVNSMREREQEIANSWTPSCPMCGKQGQKYIRNAGHGNGVLVGKKRRFICINAGCQGYDTTKKHSISFSEDRSAYSDIWGELTALKLVVLHGKSPRAAASTMEQFSPLGAQNNHTYHFLTSQTMEFSNAIKEARSAEL